MGAKGGHGLGEGKREHGFVGLEQRVCEGGYRVREEDKFGRGDWGMHGKVGWEEGLEEVWGPEAKPYSSNIGRVRGPRCMDEVLN